MRLYYAQNKEDLLIKSFFPDVDKGFYIDVGANDPVVDSVTKIFYDNGWSGLNIDPIKKHIENLKKMRPRDINLNIGVGNKQGEATFREYLEGDGLSTFDHVMQEKYNEEITKATSKYIDYKVPISTLAEVVKKYDIKKVHFLKIDVEGYEYEVIEGHDWNDVRPELVCIEANHINKDWRPLLKKHNYVEVFFDGVNNYYLAKESIKRLHYFDYPEAVFAGNPVYYPSISEIKEDVETKMRAKVVDPLIMQNNELKKIIQTKEEHAAFLTRQQRDIRFLARRLSEEIQTRLNNKTKRTQSSSHLVYKSDKALQMQLESNADKDELLKFIKEHDKKNIVKERASSEGKLKTATWKLIAKFYNLSLKIGIAIVRRAHG